jgi:hypothetical protein
MALFKTFFSIVMLLTIARVLYGQIKNKTENDVLNMPAYSKFVPAGLLAGVITSLTGLGGGVIMVPYFNKILKLPVKFSTGLSLSVIPIIALPLIVFLSFFFSPKGSYRGLSNRLHYVDCGITNQFICSHSISIWYQSFTKTEVICCDVDIPFVCYFYFGEGLAFLKNP